jgi:hypothetical protein
MRLVAEKAVEYARVKYKAGERFEAPERHARVLISVGLASQDLGELPAPTPIPAAAEVPRRRGRYANRAMRA